MVTTEATYSVCVGVCVSVYEHVCVSLCVWTLSRVIICFTTIDPDVVYNGVAYFQFIKCVIVDERLHFGQCHYS